MNICFRHLNFVKIEINLRLYCIFVNSLGKTTDKKFEKVKRKLKLWIKLLKEMFCEFDKNDIHKNYTFLLADVNMDFMIDFIKLMEKIIQKNMD